jgi:DNA-binding SARP family transcriptional activator
VYTNGETLHGKDFWKASLTAMMQIENRVSSLDIRLFGSFAVCIGGQPLAPLHSRKGHSLLALLTLRHERTVERAWLAGTLWPDSRERQALHNLRQTLSNLRHALGAEAHHLLSPTPHSLRFDLADATCDLIAFDNAIVQGDTLSLEEAVRLYPGPLLEGCLEEWVFPERSVREEPNKAAL